MREVLDWTKDNVAIPLSLLLTVAFLYVRGEIQELKDKDAKLEASIQRKVDTEIYRRDIDDIRINMRAITEGINLLIREQSNGSSKDT